jgi:hypothetical protein
VRALLLGAAMSPLAEQDHRGLALPSEGEQCTELSVARDDHELVRHCYRDEGLVGGAFETALKGVRGVVAGQSQELRQARRAVLIDEESQADGRNRVGLSGAALDSVDGDVRRAAVPIPF